MNYKSFLLYIKKESLRDEQLINIIKLNGKFRKEIKRIRNKYHLPPDGIVLSLQTIDNKVDKLAMEKIKQLNKAGHTTTKEDYLKIKNRIALTFLEQGLYPKILNSNYPNELIDKYGYRFSNDINAVVDNLLVRCKLTSRWRETIKQMILFTSATTPDPTIELFHKDIRAKGNHKTCICLKIYADTIIKDLDIWWPAIRESKDKLADRDYQRYEIENNKYEITHEDDCIYLRINKETGKKDIVNIWKNQIEKAIKNKRGYKTRLKLSTILKEDIKLINPNYKNYTNKELAEMLWGKIQTQDKNKKRKLEETRIKLIKKRKNRIKKKIDSMCV